MPVLALGVSYRRAPVELLERLAFTEDDLPKAYRRLAELGSVRGGVLLSTCNRVEIYADVESYHAGFLDLKRFLAEDREVAAEEFAEPLYAHYEDDAAEHLFDVAAGIDSMVLGERQILTQVRHAYRRAEAEVTLSPTLSTLFRAAIRAGRRARAETRIGDSPAGFVDAGLAAAEATLGSLAGRAAAVVGAGEMARLAARALADRGVASAVVANRSRERARALAEAARSWGIPRVDVAPLHDLEATVAAADVVVSSTGAAAVVLERGVVERSVAPRAGGRPLFLLDLAVPRDVDPSVRAVDGVTLVDLDGLRGRLASAAGASAQDVAAVRAILGEEVVRLAASRRAARLAPLIRALRSRGDAVARAELARTLPRLAELSERERRAMEGLAAGIVAKLLHDPIVRLKAASPASADALARALAELFDIDPRDGA